MVSWMVGILETWVQAGGAWGVFGASVFEELFSLIPSSLVQLGAGFFLLAGEEITRVTLGKLIITIGIPAAFGVTLGSFAYYAIGYFGGEPAIRRWGKWIGISWGDVERFQKRLGKHVWDDFLFFFLRATPFLPSLILTVGPGVIRMNFWKYTIITILGVWVRTIVLAFLGWQLGSTYKQYTGLFDRLEYVGLAIFIVVVLWLLLRRKKPPQEMFSNRSQ